MSNERKNGFPFVPKITQKIKILNQKFSVYPFNILCCLFRWNNFRTAKLYNTMTVSPSAFRVYSRVLYTPKLVKNKMNVKDIIKKKIFCTTLHFLITFFTKSYFHRCLSHKYKYLIYNR